MPDRASDGGMGDDLRREAEQGRWIRSFRGQDGRVTLEVINGGILNLHGHLDTEARRWLNKAQTWLDQYREGTPPGAEQEVGLHMHNWLEANVLRREAETLLSSK